MNRPGSVSATTDPAAGADAFTPSSGAVLRGRDVASARLLAGSDRARSGLAAVVLLEGDPGAGKTALCDAATRHAAAAGFRVVRAAGVEGEADLPLAGLSMVLRPLLGDLDGLIEGMPVGQRRVIWAVAGVSDAVIVDRFTLGAAAVGLISAAAERAPLLVVLDDAQWLDRPSADALSFAIRRLVADTVLVLIGSRPGQCPVTLPQGTDVVRVGGLTAAEVTAMLEDADLTVAGPVGEAIVAATAGLPLAVLETAAALSPDQRRGVVELPDPLPIGRRVTEAYRARLDVLPERSRQAVALVATAGSAPTEIVLRVLGALGLDGSDLEPAENAGVLRIGAHGVTFTHPLFRAAGLDLGAAGERRRHHRALGEAYSDPERRVRHLAAAATGVDEELAATLQDAAGQVERRAGPAAAAALLLQAAGFSESSEARCGRLLRAAQALSLAGRMDEAVRAAREVLTRTGDPGQRADAALSIANSSLWGDDSEVSLETAIAEAAQMAAVDRAKSVLALTTASVAATARGDLAASVRLAEQSVDLLDGTTPPPMAAFARENLGKTLVLVGRHREARRLFEDWTAPRADALTLTDVCGPRFPGTVQILVTMGRYTDAENLVQTLLAVCDRHAAPSARAYVLGARVELLSWQGQWLKSVALGEETITLAEDTGQPQLGRYVRATSARAFACLGDQQRCRRYADAALSGGRVHGWDPLRIFASSAVGLLELGVGNPAAAVPLLMEADQVRRACGCGDPAAVPFGADLIEALMRSGATQRARAAFGEYEELAVSSGSRWALATMARCRALLAADPDEADGCFVESVELHPPEVPFDLARTLLCWGEQRRRRRDITGSRGLLQEALTVFERLGAQPWTDRAAAELRAAGQQPRMVRAPDLQTLTAQELHCAVAVAEGMTNREAAAALFVSPKTVDYHLHKVYTKLGITSRTQLARILDTTRQSSGPTGTG